MATEKYVLDEPAQSWVENTSQTLPDPERNIFDKYLSLGWGIQPQAIMVKCPVGFVNPPHFHPVPQFQVALEGTMSFPGHSLNGIAVHYSDANTPYGPFTVGPELLFSVLRPRGTLYTGYMSDPEARKHRDSNGREVFGQEDQAEWETVNGSSGGIRRKVLCTWMPETPPKAELWKYAPNLPIPQTAAPFGEYQVVVKGSAHLSNREMKPYSMRFIRGEATGSPLTSGPQGATFLVLTFDAAAPSP